MNQWIIFGLVLVAFGCVKGAPSSPTLIQYYDEEVPKSVPVRRRPVRTPLRIVVEPVNSITDQDTKDTYGQAASKSAAPKELYSVNIPQFEYEAPKVNSAPQRLRPVPANHQYLEQKVTRIQPVLLDRQYLPDVIKPVVEEPEHTPIKVSLVASPLRLLPLPPQSFNTVRNEVQALKEKQHKYFGQSDYVDEYVQPIKVKVVADTQPSVKLAPSVQYTYETSFGDTQSQVQSQPQSQPQWPVKSKVAPQKKTTTISKSSYKLDGINDRKLIIDQLAKLDKYRLKSEESSEESDSDSSDSSSSEEDGDSSSSEESSEEENDAKEGSDEEEGDKKTGITYPINYYSQVRNQEFTKHQPAPQNDLRVQEKISTKKTNTVYSEQGYNDKTYDHGRFAKLYEVHQRYRRDLSQVASPDNNEGDVEYVEEIERLPIPLALTKVNNGTQLNGEELLTYIQDLIRNSSKFLPDDARDNDDDSFTSFLLNSAEIKKLFAIPNVTDSLPEETAITPSTAKYPYYNKPTSALRYAENPNTIPKPGQSYYAGKDTHLCGNIEPNVDPTKEQNSGTSNSRSQKKKRRLKGLDKKIDCLKKRLFGDDPVDNPLFKEEFVGDSTSDISFHADKAKINSKLVRSIEHSANPSINVYDDVISNIRSAIVAEHANVKSRNEMEILKLKSKALDSATSETSNDVNQTVVVPPNTINNSGAIEAAKGGVFDISKYLPRVYYDNSEGVLYAIRYKKRRRKKKAVPKDQHFQDNTPNTDYTVFPRLENETKPKYFTKDSRLDYSNARTKISNPIPSRKSQVPSPHFPTRSSHQHQQLSPGYYPYSQLAGRRKRFHYERIRSPY